MEELKLNQIRKVHKQRQKAKTEVFDIILGNLNKKINYYAEQEKTYCTFEVPPIVFGQPTYDINEAIMYILTKLNESKEVTAQHLQGNVIFVTWEL